jgi:transposase-like protein
MRRRQNADEVARVLREADRDLAKRLTVDDVCRKLGIAQNTYYRWRRRYQPKELDAERRCRELELEAEHLKKLAAEVLLDKQMLQDIAIKKVVSPNQQRAADYLAEEYGLSQRRVCYVMGRSRSTVRYHPKPAADEPKLVREIKRLARRHPRFGYRRLHALLIRRGWTINLKRVHRHWVELGLERPVRLRNAQKIVSKPGSWPESSAGAPTRIRSDNGSESICAALTNMLSGIGAEPIPVAAGSPWENGYIEAFHSRVRDEFLERTEFESVADARAKGSWYRRAYNKVRPHSSLGYATPSEFSKACEKKGRYSREVRVVTIIDLLPITIIDERCGLHTAEVPVAPSLYFGFSFRSRLSLGGGTGKAPLISLRPSLITEHHFESTLNDLGPNHAPRSARLNLGMANG